MLPIFLDVRRLRIALVGNGPAAARRLRLLQEAGAERLSVYAAAPSAELLEAAGARLRRRWPSTKELARARFVFLAGVPDELRAEIAQAARAAGALVHVEDAPDLSDARAAAVLRQGDLTLAVSTGGASPALAVEVRDFLGELFGPEWRGRVEEVSRQRRRWREAGLEPEAVSLLTEEWVTRSGWLDARVRHLARKEARPRPEPSRHRGRISTPPERRADLFNA